ncbi:hypothetical protein H4Q32_023395 [Labeo rohita]|uniref:Vacuolar fusion protein MON1 homolog n=1 Tax=Labeo rohita TaxID=84645 RepID=A0ABQ8M8F6_LABRO|nr:hypothetical protein H4Q32_023395 [Labeo rohita]
MDQRSQETGDMEEVKMCDPSILQQCLDQTDVAYSDSDVPSENHCVNEDHRMPSDPEGLLESADLTSIESSQPQEPSTDMQKLNIDEDRSLCAGGSETDSGKASEDSALADNGQDDSGEFVVTMLARSKMEEQGLGIKGASSPLSETGTPLGPPSHRNEDVTADSWRQHRKHVFVLSEAGKPIYSRYGSEEALSSTMGVMMALQGPLVLVSVSSSRQSEQQLRNELLYVYNQIVSMLTQASITRIFEHKKNYDLRRLLAGSEKILDGLLNLVDSDPSFLLSAVHCLPLASSLRDSLSQILQKAITPNLVFSILIAKNQLLTIVQEKMVIDDARLEPADLHLLLNLIGASSAFQAGEIWTPICLPSFNPDCYFYAYISYLDPPECTVCLVLLSTDKEAFYSVAECKRKIEEAMQTQNALNSIAKAHSYSVSQVGVSDLRHFIPEMEAPYSSEEERMRLLDLYRDMHGRIHSTSRPLKLIYHVAERETLLAWVSLSSRKPVLSTPSLNSCAGSRKRKTVCLSDTLRNTPPPPTLVKALKEMHTDQTDPTAYGRTCISAFEPNSV